MSFKSEAEVVVNQSIDDTYDFLSGEQGFLELVKLSPSTLAIDILKKDIVYLSNTDLSYTEIAGETNTEPCKRLHFSLVEQVKYVGIRIKVFVIGTQIMSSKRKLHIYESIANSGLVTVHKIRQFSSQDMSQSKVQESIEGKTMWIMSGYVGKECRRAHAEHVSRYPELLK